MCRGALFEFQFGFEHGLLLPAGLQRQPVAHDFGHQAHPRLLPLGHPCVQRTARLTMQRGAAAEQVQLPTGIEPCHEERGARIGIYGVFGLGAKPRQTDRARAAVAFARRLQMLACLAQLQIPAQSLIHQRIERRIVKACHQPRRSTGIAPAAGSACRHRCGKGASKRGTAMPAHAQTSSGSASASAARMPWATEPVMSAS
jgi:hypothetical protein